MNTDRDRIVVVGDALFWPIELERQIQRYHDVSRAAGVGEALELLDDDRETALVVIAGGGGIEETAIELQQKSCDKCAQPPELLVLAHGELPLHLEIPPEVVDFMPGDADTNEVRTRIERILAIRHRRQALERRVHELNERLERADATLVETLLRCTAYKDDEYGTHVQRINEYSGLLARLMGMPESYCKTLGLASMLHDIGKVSVPDSILQKPGKLDPDEWELVKQHCAEGANILGDPGDSRFFDMTRRIILSHHEKWDGTGYPAGLAGRNIPLEGRIVALADVLDALTTDLPYKKAWSMAEATRYIRSQSGVHFDPELVGLFLENVKDFVEIRTRLADIIVEEEVADRR